MRLAIETATNVCSVAIGYEDGIQEKRMSGKGIHSEQLFLSVDALLSENGVAVGDLEEVLISRGPGQYTGLRIAASAVKGLLFRSGVPLFTLGTLEGFAAGVISANPESDRIHAVLDARRQHLYYQRVEQGPDGWMFHPPGIEELDDITTRLSDGDWLVGSGIERLDLDESLSINKVGESGISARNLILAREMKLFSSRWKSADPARFKPDYLTSGQVSR